MTRYFYRDALQAAWMAREFNLWFTCNAVPEFQKEYEGIKAGDPFIFKAYGSWQGYVLSLNYQLSKGNLYIHPDSQDLLLPQVGDYGGDGRYSGVVKSIYQDGHVLIKMPDHDRGIDAADFVIEKRQGKAWFNPEVEEC